MTADAVSAEPLEDQGLRCHRHPDRETYVRCGRCDRPICPRCAMQGPVGFRCRTCGKPAHDPLTSFSMPQLLGGFAMALGAGTVAGLIGLQTGFFAIFIGFFGGGLIADLVMRVTGFKRGPIMVAILIGGIGLGTALAVAGSYWLFLAEMARYVDEEEVIDLSLAPYLASIGSWAILFAGAAMAGAWGRLRF